MTINNGEKVKGVQKLNMPNGVEAINVYYFKCDFIAGQTEADVMDQVELQMEALYDDIKAEIVDDCTIGELDVYVYDGVDQEWDKIGTRSPTVTFGSTADMLPHGVAGVIRAYTENPRVIARKYIPGLAEDRQTQGAWLSNWLTAAAAFAVELASPRAISTNNTLIPGSFSTVLLDVIPFDGTSVILANPGYQRRRRPGVGS